jgi:hypothetical protein
MKFSQFKLGKHFSGLGRRESNALKRTRKSGLFLSMEPLDDRIVMTVSTWSGAVDTLWSTAGNWDIAPIAGDTLIFPSTATSFTSVNDFAAGQSFGNITINGSGYSITGNSISLEGSIDSTQNTGGNLLGLNLTFTGANSTINVAQTSANLSLSGAIVSPTVLDKIGSGRLVFTNSLTYSGPTKVDAGILLNQASLNGSLLLNSGAILNGDGSSTGLTSIGGNIIPGAFGFGIVSSTGELALDSNSGFSTVLNGTTPGTQYGQIQANGPIQLGNSTLIVTLGSTPNSNETYTLINNTGNAAISGNFVGLAEGSLLTVSGQTFKISYVGGDGNDAMITHQVGTATVLTTSLTPSVYGQPIDLTANVSVTGNGTATGNVTFYNGANVIGSAPLNANGSATFTTGNLSVGTGTLKAVYSGSDNFLTSTSANLTQTVNKASTVSTVISSLNPSVVGQFVGLSASVFVLSPGIGSPTGNVTFFNGNTSLGSGTLNGSGTATLNLANLPVGNQTITVTYAGDANFTTSNSTALTQVVNKTVANVTLTSTTVSPEASGLITLTANVATSSGAPAPTGTVGFFSNGSLIGTGNLTNGVATYTTTGFYLGLGVDSITTTYNGDTNYETSDSNALNVTAGTENERFINQAYVVLLNRQVDYQGMNQWNTRLQHGRSRTWVARAIRHSIEGQAALIDDIFNNYLGRSGTAPQLAGTVLAAENTSTSPRAIVLGSPEYYYGEGGGTIPSYITALETSLNTTFSAAAKATMTRELKAGKLHAAVAEQALLSNSGLGSLGQLLYQTTLGRDATDSEITTFKKLSKQGVYWRFQQTYIMGGQEFLNYAKIQPGTAPV